MDSNSDNALMLKVRSGNLDKLGLLFERYNRKLFHYFYRLTYRRDLSEDLVQGVFERIIKYRHTYESTDAFSTWIYRIARNIHIDHYRKNGREYQQDENFNFDSLRSETDENDVEFEQSNFELELLKLALDRLDPIKKETLVLSRFQGFKYKEIAGIMDCSESAVKVRIYRAINDLKQIVSELRKENNYE